MLSLNNYVKQLSAEEKANNTIIKYKSDVKQFQEIVGKGKITDEKLADYKAELMEEKNHTYRELLQTMTRDDVTDEVRNTLKQLREAGFKLALGSSSKNARFILEKVELLDAFDAISDGNNITHSKPHPEVFLKAAEFLGEKPEDCVVVEDAYAGIDAAKAAGMKAVGIGDAAGYEKADDKIQRFEELLNIATENM